VGTAIENFVSLPHFLTIFPFRIFPCEEALIVLKLVMPAFGQGELFVCMAAKPEENSTSVQEILFQGWVDYKIFVVRYTTTATSKICSQLQLLLLLNKGSSLLTTATA
jgi:hypothetical protein